MKKIYATIGLFLATLLSAQIPQAFSYQTIAFNSAGAPIANGNVSLRISILENSATGTVLYTETHNKTTNSKGLVNLNIGQGTPSSGSFGGINWGTNTKFVKVEMDPAGGNNYTNVGVNQLMSVPYAQVSKTVVTGAGQGITLTSPNGTTYNLNVSDNGILSMPTSSNSSTATPANLYLYGSYNNFDANSAELLRNVSNSKIGYKYFAANSQIKFLTAPNSSAQSYGVGSQSVLIANGNNTILSSNGFYKINVFDYGMSAVIQIDNFVPKLIFNSPSLTTSSTTYNPATNKFSITISSASTGNFTGLRIHLPTTNSNSETLGDNLSDGNFDVGGDLIMLPNLSTTPKNYKIEFSINFNATGTYTITQI